MLLFENGKKLIVNYNENSLPIQKDKPYLTRIEFPNGDYYEGIVVNGKYNG
jgi:hypothetical protein